MAVGDTYYPIAKILGTIPGGGSADRASNTSDMRNELGMKVVGIDPVGFRGEWVYVKFNELISCTYAVMPYSVSAGYGTTTASQFTVEPAKAPATDEIAGPGAGVVEACTGNPGSVSASYYGWIRTKGGPVTMTTEAATVTPNLTNFVVAYSGAGIPCEATAAATTAYPFATGISKTANATVQKVILHCNVY